MIGNVFSIPVAMIDHNDLERKRVDFIFPITVHDLGKTGWELDTTEQGRSTACLLASSGLLCLLCYSVQAHTHRGGTGHSRLSSPTSITIQDNAMPRGQAFGWTSPLRCLLSICFWVPVKLTKPKEHR